jgi:hypothetical protein
VRLPNPITGSKGYTPVAESDPSTGDHDITNSPFKQSSQEEEIIEMHTDLLNLSDFDEFEENTVI